MLRKLRDMPAGTLGFEAVGEVDDDVKVLSVLLPGEAKAFPVRELSAAKRWWQRASTRKAHLAPCERLSPGRSSSRSWTSTCEDPRVA
jgi:hypothetical protein